MRGVRHGIGQIHSGPVTRHVGAILPELARRSIIQDTVVREAHAAALPNAAPLFGGLPHAPVEHRGHESSDADESHEGRDLQEKHDPERGRPKLSNRLNPPDGEQRTGPGHDHDGGPAEPDLSPREPLHESAGLHEEVDVHDRAEPDDGANEMKVASQAAEPADGRRRSRRARQRVSGVPELPTDLSKRPGVRPVLVTAGARQAGVGRELGPGSGDGGNAESGESELVARVAPEPIDIFDIPNDFEAGVRVGYLHNGTLRTASYLRWTFARVSTVHTSLYIEANSAPEAMAMLELAVRW